MLLNPDNLITEFRKAAPGALIRVCLFPPPNNRGGAFVANDKEQHPRWNCGQVLHRIVERRHKHLFGLVKEKVEPAPTGLGVDTWKRCPGGNAVYPNGTCHRAIGALLYAWLKHQLAMRDAPLRDHEGSAPN